MHGMKAQTDNAEHINDNCFSILFYGSRIQTTRIQRTRSYALYKRSCYYRETGTITKFNFEATKFKGTSFVCSLASFYVAYR